jgi:arylsulfatase A-like enzyme
MKNLLLITIDSSRADALHCLGNIHAETPTFDRLAQKGIAYSNAICQAPYTVA